MADQVHVAQRLDPDHTDELAVLLVSPELDPGVDLARQLLGGHVRLVPAVSRDHAAVGLRGGIHEREDRLALVVSARANAHAAGLCWAAIWMRLPQVSSRTAVVTGPISAGCWVKRTPRPLRRSNSP